MTGAVACGSQCCPLLVILATPPTSAAARVTEPGPPSVARDKLPVAAKYVGCVVAVVELAGTSTLPRGVRPGWDGPAKPAVVIAVPDAPELLKGLCNRGVKDGLAERLSLIASRLSPLGRSNADLRPEPGLNAEEELEECAVCCTRGTSGLFNEIVGTTVWTAARPWAMRAAGVVPLVEPGGIASDALRCPHDVTTTVPPLLITLEVARELCATAEPDDGDDAGRKGALGPEMCPACTELAPAIGPVKESDEEGALPTGSPAKFTLETKLAKTALLSGRHAEATEKGSRTRRALNP